MNCQHCQKPLQPEFNVCPYCATPVNRKPICPGCHKDVDAAWAVCPFCSTNLRQSAPVSAAPNYPPNQDPRMYPKHGYSNDSSNRQHRRKGFLGSLFSS